MNDIDEKHMMRKHIDDDDDAENNEYDDDVIIRATTTILVIIEQPSFASSVLPLLCLRSSNPNFFQRRNTGKQTNIPSGTSIDK
jgi:hypothetical protein